MVVQKDNHANNAVGTLYLEIKQTCEDPDRLSHPTPDMSLAELWWMLEHQLHCSAWDIAQKISDITQLPVSRNILEVNAGEILGKIPYKLAVSEPLVPVRKENGITTIAISNPFDTSLQEKLRFILDDNFRCEIAPPDAIQIAVARSYNKKTTGSTFGSLNLNDSLQYINDADSADTALPRLARQLLIDAINKKASDLHIHPFIGGSAVRVRIDGLLQRVVILPEKVSDSLIRYFKARAGMDPANKLIPQDGQMMLDYQDREFDLRLSVLPVTGHGEKLVIRILNRKSVYTLSATGMSLDEIHTLRRMASAPSGVILFCGPTGSGKTTTLYSILNELNSETISITTVENPVEYKMAGLSQTEVNEKAGLTFAAALRSILRQDPDVILIGEIRDEQTAQIALQAALTGHLVFSTLHTNDAFSAFPRLFDLGIRPAVLADSLTGIVSQRLLRRLCEACKVPTAEPFTNEEVQFKKLTRSDQPYRPRGCSLCDYSGFTGRKIITEMIEMTPVISRLISEGESDSEKLKTGCAKTYESMSLSASRAIISGETTISEAVHTIGMQFWRQLAIEYKSDPPDLASFGAHTGDERSGTHSILFTGKLDEYTDEFQQMLKLAWFDVYRAGNPEEAKQALQSHEDIYLVILNLDGGESDDEIIKSVDTYRVAMAWSRLPAILVLPDNRRELEKLLRDAGATSRFIYKSTPNEDIITMINEAISKRLDFKWGLEN